MMCWQGKSSSSGQTGIVSKSGFTLLEILVALALFAIAISILVQLFSSNLRTIATSGQYLPAMIMAQARMSEVLAADALEEQTFREVSEEGYRVDVTIIETLTQKTQSLPVKLMEIDLTVTWQVDHKEKSINLKTYKTVSKTASSAMRADRDTFGRP